SALVLSRFRRCYVPLREKEREAPNSNAISENWLNYQPENWHATAERELAPYEPLADISRDLKKAWPDKTPVTVDDPAGTIEGEARAFYELLWASCTRSEKLVLVQLAQEGFVNPKSRDVVRLLVAKGLIEGPAPTIFNYTFRDFLCSIERDHVVHEW